MDRPPASTTQDVRCTLGETEIASLVGRYYDPATEQFLSMDPLVDETGTPYAFTDGDPVNRSDPTGSMPCAEGACGSIQYLESLSLCRSQDDGSANPAHGSSPSPTAGISPQGGEAEIQLLPIGGPTPDEGGYNYRFKIVATQAGALLGRGYGLLVVESSTTGPIAAVNIAGDGGGRTRILETFIPEGGSVVITVAIVQSGRTLQQTEFEIGNTQEPEGGVVGFGV